MKIITWNVNGIRAVAQKGFLEFVERESPDILCLQETKAHRDQLTEELVIPPGYKSFWSAAQKPGYSGVVTYCREMPLSVKYGIDIPKYDTEGRIVVTEFKSFTLFNIYFPNGGSGDERHLYKQEFLKRLQSHVKRRIDAGEEIIVAGDYNVAYMEIDVYDPKRLKSKSGFLPEEREWFTQFLDSGFIDTFRYFHPNEANRYSWWAYYENARIGNNGWRIDHICASRGLEGALKAADILDQQDGSDHCPVVLELKS